MRPAERLTLPFTSEELEKPLDSIDMGALEGITELFVVETDKLIGPVGEKGGWEDRFWTPPVNVEQFCKDFLRQPLWPEQARALLAIFGEDPEHWKSSPFEEVDLFWGKGSGKSDAIADAFSFGGYWLRNRKDPWDYFSKTAGDNIDLINVSFNARQAKNVFFRKLKAKMRKAINPNTGDSWFAERGVDLREGGKHIQGRVIYLDNDRLLAIHAGDSVEYTGEGLNLALALCDELGAFGRADKALALHGALKDTVKTRFGKRGCTVAISYQYSANDAMTMLVQEAEKPENREACYVSRKATFEVNPKVKKEDLQSEYRRNPERAKRVFECAGSAVGPNAFFKYPEEIRGRANRNRQSPVKGDRWFWEGDLKDLPLEDWFKGAPGAEYHFRVDLAKGGERKDKVGLALARKFRKKPSWSRHYLKAKEIGGETPEAEMNGIGPGDLILGDREEEAVWFDLLLQLRAPTQEGEVRFQSIIDFVAEELVQRRGFNITLVTYDGWQSAGEIQRLNERGITAKLLSCDKTSGPADTLKGLIYNGLADYYAHPVFMREAEELVELGNGKVDHPDLSPKRSVEEGDNRGSKDVWDAGSGCAETLLNPEAGSGGYRLGF